MVQAFHIGQASGALFLFLAGLVCILGAMVSVRLWDQVHRTNGRLGAAWIFLAAITTGATIWSTHFLAMLDFNPDVVLGLDPLTTVLAANLAIAGTAIALSLSRMRGWTAAVMCAGIGVGVTIPVTFFVGVRAYHIDGQIMWDAWTAVAAVILACAFSVIAFAALRSQDYFWRKGISALCMALAVVTSHFIGAAALNVEPHPDAILVQDPVVAFPLAIAVTLITAMIVCIGMVTDMIRTTVVENSRKLLHQQALQDPLTGIANRRHFLGALEKRMETATLKEPLALLVIDLDRFKAVNDSFGHPVGDVVLRRVVQRLQRVLDDEDLVARMGGDEFCILTRSRRPNCEDLHQVAENIIEIVSRPYLVSGCVLDIGASIGISNAAEARFDQNLLVKQADMALFAVKRAGRGAYQFFDPEVAKELDTKRQLAYALRRAVAKEAFTLSFQPQIRAKDGSFVGAEALIRWTNDDVGPIKPEIFIPLAEEMGLIHVIGQWVLRTACQEAARWPDHLSVAVNLSPVQLADVRLVGLVTEILRETQLDPSRLELEITETAIMRDDKLALTTLDKLRALGVHISLDDFGTGYSSLSHLHKYPIEKIKIDRGFIQQAGDNDSSAKIVEVIAQMGAVLGMTVTAEGVETASQLAFVEKHGCDYVQGYFTGRPMPPEDIRTLFRRHKSNAA